MNTYLRNLFVYFENVLHPAAGWSGNDPDKRKKNNKKTNSLQASPDGFNLRGGLVKKQDKQRRNPAP